MTGKIFARKRSSSPSGRPVPCWNGPISTPCPVRARTAVQLAQSHPNGRSSDSTPAPATARPCQRL